MTDIFDCSVHFTEPIIQHPILNKKTNLWLEFDVKQDVVADMYIKFLRDERAFSINICKTGFIHHIERKNDK